MLQILKISSMILSDFIKKGIYVDLNQKISHKIIKLQNLKRHIGILTSMDRKDNFVVTSYFHPFSSINGEKRSGQQSGNVSTHFLLSYNFHIVYRLPNTQFLFISFYFLPFLRFPPIQARCLDIPNTLAVFLSCFP